MQRKLFGAMKRGRVDRRATVGRLSIRLISLSRILALGKGATGMNVPA